MQMPSSPRPDSIDCEPHPSLLCPHCLAGEHLCRWVPAGISVPCDTLGTPLPLPPEALQGIQTIMAESWAPSTQTTYRSGLLAFHIFCDQHGVLDTQCMPASHDLITAFVAAASRVRFGKTISGYVAGVCAWHLLHCLPWRMDQLAIDTLLCAADHSTPGSACQKLRQPFTLDYITAFARGLDLLHSPLDVAVFWVHDDNILHMRKTGQIYSTNSVRI